MQIPEVIGEVVVDPKLLQPLSLQSMAACPDLFDPDKTCLIHSLVTCKSGGAGSGSGAGGLYLTCFPACIKFDSLRFKE